MDRRTLLQLAAAGGSLSVSGCIDAIGSLQSTDDPPSFVFGGLVVVSRGPAATHQPFDCALTVEQGSEIVYESEHSVEDVTEGPTLFATGPWTDGLDQFRTRVETPHHRTTVDTMAYKERLEELYDLRDSPIYIEFWLLSDTVSTQFTADPPAHAGSSYEDLAALE